MMPRLPMNVPRCGIATISPNGVTRFCRGPRSPYIARPAALLTASADAAANTVLYFSPVALPWKASKHLISRMIIMRAIMALLPTEGRPGTATARLISGTRGAIWPFAGPSRRPSLALDPGQAVLDPGLRPGTPRHGEELEPLLDEEVRVHLGRDEIHPGGDAVLRGGRRDFLERSLIDVALVVEWHPRLDRKIGRADQQDVDARDRGDGIEVLQRLVRLDHRHDNEPVVHGVEVIAVILELAPLAAHPGVAAVAEGKIAAGAAGGAPLRAGVDHRHHDAPCPGGNSKRAL